VRVANERLRGLSRELITSQEVERTHIAEELHEGLGQALTEISVDLGIIERDLRTETVRDSGQRLSEVREMAHELDERISELAYDLRPSMLDHLGLLPTLRWFADRFSKRADVEIELDVIGFEERVPLEIETALYRVIQEVLTNVARHALATEVRLRLEQHSKAVTVTIEDDGRGFDVEELQATESPRKSLGLVGMNERISLLGGRLDIHSEPGDGARIEIEIPL
jgi:signal transduction histidine kinase